MSKTNQTLQEILEDHTLRVGRQVTDSYKMKNGLWEGMSVQNVKSLNQALKEISELLVECKPEKDRIIKFSGDSRLDQMVQHKIDGYNQAIDDYEKNIKARLQ